MLTLTELHFWLAAVWFGLAVIIGWYIPGRILVHGLPLEPFTRRTISLLLGIVLFGWQGYVFGYLGIRWASYLFLAVCVWYYFRQVYRKPKTIRNIRLTRPDLWTVSIILLGMAVQFAAIGGNGLMFAEGQFFCCGNHADNFFFYSLSRELVARIPPREPGMYSEVMVNYHYWSNLTIAEMSRIFAIPLTYVQFQFLPMIVTLCLGLSAIALTRVLKLKTTISRWMLFFLYFGADAMYFPLIFVRNLGAFPSLSSLDDGTKFLVNPARAMAIVIGLAAMALFLTGTRQNSRRAEIIAYLMFATLFGFKVYIGIFFAVGLCFHAVLRIAKRDWSPIVTMPVFFLIPFLLVYVPPNANAGGLIWAPLNIVHDFIVQPALRLERWELARYIFYDHANIPRIIQYETMFTVLFLLAVFGTRLLSVLYPKYQLRTFGWDFTVIGWSAVLTNILIGLLFIQTSGGANSFNFLVSAMVFMSIPAGLAVDTLLKTVKHPLRLLFSGLIVILTIPRIVLSLSINAGDYLSREYLMVPPEELAAYEYIRDNTPDDALFIVDPDLGIDVMTPYVYAYTGKPMYGSGISIIASHGYETEEWKFLKETIFVYGNTRDTAEALRKTNADYILIWNERVLPSVRSADYTEEVFSNRLVTIRKVDKSGLNAFLSEPANLL